MPPSSSGLGHSPFKAAAGIRIPLGARESPLVNWEFSSAGEHLPYKQGVTGSNPVTPTSRYLTCTGSLKIILKISIILLAAKTAIQMGA